MATQQVLLQDIINSIKDIMEYCSLESSSEIEYKFVSKDTKEDELKLMFKNSYDERKQKRRNRTRSLIRPRAKTCSKRDSSLNLWERSTSTTSA